MKKIGFKRQVGSLSIERVADQILHIKLENDVMITKEDMADYLAAVRDDYEGKKFANLVEFGDLSNVTKEAREYAATSEANELTVADAFVLKSLSQRILGNFYLKVDRPVVPTKLFADAQSARKWLEEILAKLENQSL